MVLWFDAHWPPKPWSNNGELTVAITYMGEGKDEAGLPVVMRQG